MPVRATWTTRAGRRVRGYRWGTTGKIYVGRGARERARRQGRAITARGYRG